MSSITPALADRVLLVEDCEDDIFQFQRLLRRASVDTALDVVTDGESAVRWLTERLAAHANGSVSLPRALFLDLRLPGMRGADVLRWIREQTPLDRALVVVWSSSVELRDIAEADRLGADLYVNKFPAVEQFAALMRVTDPRSLRPEVFGDHRGAVR
jgi:CheY-like chemotaxis protein